MPKWSSVARWMLVPWVVVAVYFAASVWLSDITAGRGAASSVWPSLLVSVAQFWPWTLATPLVVITTTLWPLLRPRAVMPAAVHVAVGLAVATATTWTARQTRQWFFGYATPLLPSHVAFDLLVYAAVVASVSVSRAYEASRVQELRAAQVEARLHEANLQLLQSQLQPHFLFNAINTIAETVHDDPDKADQMLMALAALLRAALADAAAATPLAEELALARAYLAIQQVRFGERLAVSFAVPDALAARPVPRLILQPLLENAVLHGIGPSHRAGRVSIAARVEGDAVRLEVTDDGVGYSDRGSQGLGLANVRARLAAMYGTGASLSIERLGTRGTTVSVLLPAA